MQTFYTGWDFRSECVRDKNNWALRGDPKTGFQCSSDTKIILFKFMLKNVLGTTGVMHASELCSEDTIIPRVGRIFLLVKTHVFSIRRGLVDIGVCGNYDFYCCKLFNLREFLCSCKGSSWTISATVNCFAQTTKEFERNYLQKRSFIRFKE